MYTPLFAISYGATKGYTLQRLVNVIREGFFETMAEISYQSIRSRICTPRDSLLYSFEPGHSCSYKIACAPCEDSDYLAHPRSLIRVFAGHAVGSNDLKRLPADSEDWCGRRSTVVT